MTGVEQSVVREPEEVGVEQAIKTPVRPSWVRRMVPTSLVARIALINILGLLLLSLGILYFNQLRQGLINARSESLLVQGQIIASAIAGAATADTSTIVIDPDKLDPETNTGDANDSSMGGSYFQIGRAHV